MYDLEGNTLHTEDFYDLAMSAPKELGCIPHRRPHMVRPNKNSMPHTHVLIPFFDRLSGIHILDANTREIVGCFNTDDYGPGLVHDVSWAYDDSFFVAVDLSGLVHKFSSDLESNTFAYENSFSIVPYMNDLETSVVKPISAEVTRNGLIYVTMSKGG